MTITGLIDELEILKTPKIPGTVYIVRQLKWCGWAGDFCGWLSGFKKTKRMV